MQIRLAIRAREWYIFDEVYLKEVQNLLQPLASIPEGPAAPEMRSAADLIKSAPMQSKTTGCMSTGSPLVSRMEEAEAGWPDGCLLSSTSRTERDSPSLEGMESSACKTPPLP